MTLPRLAHPRRYAISSNHPAVKLAEQSLASAAALQPEVRQTPLVAYFRDVLERKTDQAIPQVLAEATSPAVYRCLVQALDAALRPAPAGDADVRLQLFALPVLIVTGGAAGMVVPAVLPDVSRVRQVLEESGVLGRVRNFGLGNALCSLGALESVPFQQIYDLAQAIPVGAEATLDLPPAEIRAGSADEEVHLRYLVGAALTPADAPSFLETGSAIATWGLPLTRELAEQMRVPGASVLPIPRPPATLLAARASGFIAREDLALQAFVSRALRRSRAEVGEPDTTLAALESGAIGVRFALPFVENRVDVHRRLLHPSEELDEVERGILGLLEECRVAPVQVLEQLVPDADFAANRAPPSLQ